MNWIWHVISAISISHFRQITSNTDVSIETAFTRKWVLMFTLLTDREFRNIEVRHMYSSLLDSWTEHIVVSLWNDQQMLKEVVDFLLISSKIYSDMFRQMLCVWVYTDYDRPVWPVVGCIQVYTGVQFLRWLRILRLYMSKLCVVNDIFRILRIFFWIFRIYFFVG
jgi:hypothetical protein